MRKTTRNVILDSQPMTPDYKPRLPDYHSTTTSGGAIMSVLLTTDGKCGIGRQVVNTEFHENRSISSFTFNIHDEIRVYNPAIQLGSLWLPVRVHSIRCKSHCSGFMTEFGRTLIYSYFT